MTTYLGPDRIVRSTLFGRLSLPSAIELATSEPCEAIED